MQISNRLNAQSFQYTDEKPNLLVRSQEIRNLSDIDVYCKKIDEWIQASEDLWSIEVEEGLAFADWLYSTSGEANHEDRRFLQELLTKNALFVVEDTEIIQISLGKQENCVSDANEYIDRRRSMLKTLTNPNEFSSFMPSCFINCVFAHDIEREMRNIDNFENYTKDIVDNLAVLNDEAVSLYEQYHDNLKVAMDILTSKLLQCSPDPKHAHKLKFDFAYEETNDGIKELKYKTIECSPHLKLIHRGSNLRIYFYWRDDIVGNGEKVLIGRIGGHPY